MSDNRVALVTGASRGIGAAIAERLARNGFDLTISARGREALDERARALREFGTRVEVATADMSDDQAILELADGHHEHFGRCDALVINAGMGQRGRIEDFPVRRLDRLYAVNVRAPFILLQKMLPLLRSSAAKHGVAKVIALASSTGVYPEPGYTAYGSTKAALINMCETFNLEESENGVSATTIAPGYVDTDMTEWTKDAIPAAEMISANDIAVLAHAVTELSRYAVVPNVVAVRPGSNLHRA